METPTIDLEQVIEVEIVWRGVKSKLFITQTNLMLGDRMKLQDENSPRMAEVTLKGHLEPVKE